MLDELSPSRIPPLYIIGCLSLSLSLSLASVFLPFFTAFCLLLPSHPEGVARRAVERLQDARWQFHIVSYFSLFFSFLFFFPFWVSILPKRKTLFLTLESDLYIFLSCLFTSLFAACAHRTIPSRSFPIAIKPKSSSQNLSLHCCIAHLRQPRQLVAFIFLFLSSSVSSSFTNIWFFLVVIVFSASSICQRL